MTRNFYRTKSIEWSGKLSTPDAGPTTDWLTADEMVFLTAPPRRRVDWSTLGASKNHHRRVKRISAAFLIDTTERSFALRDDPSGSDTRP